MINPDIFNDVPIFALLDADERQVLALQVSVKTFSKGEIIFKEGDPGGYAYLVQQGRVNVCIKDIADEIVTVDVVEDGGLLGMSSLLASAAHLTTATAVEDTHAIEIDRNDISTLLQKKPLAGLDMMTMIEKQLRATHELMRTRVSRNPNIEIEETESFGERVADGVAIVLITYTTINSVIQKPWDPYPFILLNLFLSMLAAIQAPVIMMSQNRQDSKDRVRSELDYRVNLKAELEIGEILQRMGRLEQRLADMKKK